MLGSINFSATMLCCIRENKQREKNTKKNRFLSKARFHVTWNELLCSNNNEWKIRCIGKWFKLSESRLGSGDYESVLFSNVCNRLFVCNRHFHSKRRRMCMHIQYALKCQTLFHFKWHFFFNSNNWFSQLIKWIPFCWLSKPNCIYSFSKKKNA